MAILEVTLSAGTAVMSAMGHFYADRLGCAAGVPESERLALRLGETTLTFEASSGDPFYHVALLVPGDRFVPAYEWARERAVLLPGDDGSAVFPFAFWNAQACYFLDPSGNIVELVAHRGCAETGRSGSFAADEIVGVSEIGIVGEPEDVSERLAGELGLELWDGVVGVPERLAFVGEKARTLILASEGRPWLPTGRPAEQHPVDVTFSGQPWGDVKLASGGWIRRRSYLA